MMQGDEEDIIPVINLAIRKSDRKVLINAHTGETVVLVDTLVKAMQIVLDSIRTDVEPQEATRIHANRGLVIP